MTKRTSVSCKDTKRLTVFANNYVRNLTEMRGGKRGPTIAERHDEVLKDRVFLRLGELRDQGIKTFPMVPCIAKELRVQEYRVRDLYVEWLMQEESG